MGSCQRLFPLVALTIIALAVAISASEVNKVSSRRYYNIAHMTNTVPAIKWAIEEGANGIEVDLVFRGSSPTRFTHAFPCDCICASSGGSVCRHAPCGSGSDAGELLRYVAATNLSLVVIDGKINPVSMSYELRQDAGAETAKLIDENLFAKGFKGQVVIGVPTMRAANFLEAAVDEVATSRWKSKYYFTIDGETNKIAQTIATLQKLKTKNIVYGTGISACAVDNLSWSTVDTVVAKTVSKEIGLAYVWTVDSESTMKSYVQKFGGIMTNRPGRAANVIRNAGLKLATQSDVIPPAADRPTTDQTCDCNYSKAGGCKIVKPAPPNSACKCQYRGAWTCRGHLSHCLDTDSQYCKNPDSSLNSCLQGGGDCDGYQGSSCTCSYSRNGGCVITNPAPYMMACHCRKRTSWSCTGSLVKCQDATSKDCRRPGTSYLSCQQGRGNCSGYKKPSSFNFGRLF